MVSKTNTWHDKQILIEAQKAGVLVEKVDFFDWKEFLKVDWSFAPVIFWRSSSLGQGELRLRALRKLEKMGKIVVNQGWTKWPMMTHKFFQQNRVAQFLGNDISIPTYVFENKKQLTEFLQQNDQLVFPIIKKPNLGFRGIGVSKIDDWKDLDEFSDEEIEKSVFQNFIENDGDYRILMLGGCPLGVMKRIAKKNTFLNNISQGGVGMALRDDKLFAELTKTAVKIATLFDLGFCGVDLIVDKKSSQIYFLEINTVPQWQGFQKTNKINVGKLIIEYVCSLVERNKSKSAFQIEKFYSDALFLPEDKKFHFYSRLFLWTGKKEYREKINLMKEYFLGGEWEKDWLKKIKEIIKDRREYQEKVVNGKIFREKIIKKYPNLGVYHELLFRFLMAENVFRADWRTLIEKEVSHKELLDYGERFMKNKKDLRGLSTFAVNFLFLLAFFLKEEKFTQKIKRELLAIVEKIEIKKREGDLMKNDFYFLSHCIVAGSGFYSRKVAREDDLFSQALEKMESILEDDYEKISLDNKLEFLVCACLVGRKSFLKEKILKEAEQSFSPIGNFLVDVLNERKEDFSRKDFFSSEHRNVLYIMAGNDYKNH